MNLLRFSINFFFGIFLVFFFFSPAITHAATNPVFRATLSTATTTASNSFVVPFDTVAYDTLNGWSTTTNMYLPSLSGYYRVSFGIVCDFTAVNPGTCDTRIRRNSSAFARTQTPIPAGIGVGVGSLTEVGASASAVLFMDGVTDTISLQLNSVAGARPTLGSSNGYQHIDIEYVGDIPEFEAVEPPITYYDWLIVVMLFLFINSIPMWLYFTSNMYSSRSRPKNTW